MSTMQEDEAFRKRERERKRRTSPSLSIGPRSIKTSPSLIYRTTLIAAPLKDGARTPTSISSELL